MGMIFPVFHMHGIACVLRNLLQIAARYCILHNSVNYNLLPITTEYEHTEVQKISVCTEVIYIDIINIYIVPAS